MNPFAFITSIQVQTKDLCNRKCSFCPNSVIEKLGEEMSEEVFIRILDELARLEYKGRLHLYLQNEPTLDTRLPRWTRLARERLTENPLFISTNGDFLLPMLDDLLAAGMSEIAVCCYDDAHKAILKHYWSNAVKYMGRVFFLPMGELEPTFYNRAGLIDVESQGTGNFCHWLFSKMSINWKGDLILCCSDYHYQVVMGNVMDQPLDDIWMCDKYQTYRRAHHQGRAKSMPLCDVCNRIV